MTYASTILADNPVAFYRLDESSGLVANDLTANAYNGTYSGSGVTLGQVGALLKSNDAAVLFDGVAGNVALPAGLSPAGYSAITVEAWVKLSTTSFSGTPRIVSNATTTSNKGINLYFNANAASAAVTLGNGTNNFTATTSGFTFVAGVWYYIVGRWDGSTLNIWVNGQLLGTATLSGGSIAASTTNLALAYAPVTSTNFFPGDLDEFAIYNTALPNARIFVHYISGLFGTTPPVPVDNPYGFNLFHPSGIGVANMCPMIPQILLDMIAKNQTLFRYQIPWSRIETSPGVYQWGALDAAVYACYMAGINLNFNIFNPPSWQLTRPSTDGTMQFADITGSATFASAIAARYNGVFNVPNYGPMTIAVLEMGNEDYDRQNNWSNNPNTNSARDQGGSMLAPVMIATVPAVAAVNTVTKIFPACVLKQDATHVATWLAGYYGGGAGPYTLMTHFHFYKSGGNPPSHGYTFDQAWQAVQAGNAAAGYPKMDVWVTETGWPTTANNHAPGDVVSAATQWSYWQEELDDGRLNGVISHIIWYEIGTNDGDSITQGGMVDGSVETYVQPTWTNLGNYARQHPSWGATVPVSVGGVAIGGSQIAIREDDFQISQRLDERWQATFTVLDYAGSQFFSYRERLSIADLLLGMLFSGFVADVQQDKSNSYPDSLIEHHITAMDNRALADKRTSNRLYTSPTYAGKIVVDMHADVLAAEGVIAYYAVQDTETQADWSTGTLSSVVATNNVGDGDLELAGSGGVVSASYAAAADWATGTLINVVANSGGDLSLIGSTRNWDDGNTANQTLYGLGSPTQSVLSKIYILSCTKQSEARSRLDFAGTWNGGTIAVDMYVGGVVALNSLTYLTTAWNNNDNTYAYAIEFNESAISLRKGANASSGSSSQLASHSFSPPLSGGWYRVQVVVSAATHTHTVYVNGTQYLSVTDSTYTTAGYIALRNRNTELSTTNNMQFDNFGVMQSLSGTWVSPSTSVNSVALVNSSIIKWDTSLSTGGTITVSVSTDGGSTYHTCSNGGSIPTLGPGSSGTGKSVIVKVALSNSTTATMPDVKSLSWSVQGGYVSSGTRISPPLDLTPTGRCGSTVVSWNANLPTNTALGIDVSPDGLTWYDVSAQNGGPIPFITGEPEPTFDGFDADTSANYSSGTVSGSGDTFAGRTVGSGFGTASSGQVWALTQGTGTISVSSGEGRIATPTDNNILILGSTQMGDGVLQVRLTQADAVNDDAWIFARYQGVNNFYRLSLNGQTLAIQKKLQGTFSTLVQATVATTAGTFYQMKLTLAGSTLSGKIWQDGTGEPVADIISVTDTAFASGNYGLGGSANTSTPIEFDSFVVSLNVWTFDTTHSRLVATSPAASLYLNTTLAPGNVDLLTDIDISDGGGLVFNAVDTSDYYSLIVADNQASIGTPNTISLYKTTGTPGSITPLTLYGQNTASTTLPTANILSTSTGTGTTNKNTKVGTSTGIGQLWSQGNTSAWPSLTSIPGPDGHGFLWDVTTLEGQQLAAGNCQPILRLTTSVGSLVADLHVRVYIYHSVNGTYTQVGEVIKTSQTISTANTIFTLPATGFGASAIFNPGDKLYYAVYPNILTNNTGSSAAVIQMFMASVAGIGVANNAELITPGYQAPGGGTATTTLLASAPISFVRGIPRRIRATNEDGLLTCYFDGDEMLSYLDPAPLGAGSVGLINNGGAVGSRYYQLWVQPLGDDLTGLSVYTRQRLSTTDTTVTPQVLSLTVAAFGPQIDIGTLIPSADYRYTFVDKNLDDLGKQSNISWFIDQNLVLNFNGRQANPAPWVLSSNTIAQPSDIEADNNLVVEVSGDLYRNRQVLTGVTNSGPFSDPFVGDGSRTSFTLRYPIAPGTTPTVTLNNTKQAVGLKGGSGAQWYYAVGDLTIAQDTAGTTLTGSDTLIVSYTGTFLDTVVVDNVAAQTALSALEGGTGIVEAVQDVSNPGMQYPAALTYANQLLTRYCIDGRTLTFLTQRNGLAIGQILPVFLPEENLYDAQMLIHEITITMQTQPNQTILYNYLVVASELPKQAGWAKLLAAGLLD